MPSSDETNKANNNSSSISSGINIMMMRKNRNNMQMYFIVGVFAVICYINSLSGDFVHDDLPAIVYNEDVLGKSSLTDMLLNDFWGMRMKHKHSHKSYRPLTTFTFRYEFSLNSHYFSLKLHHYTNSHSNCTQFRFLYFIVLSVM